MVELKKERYENMEFRQAEEDFYDEVNVSLIGEDDETSLPTWEEAFREGYLASWSRNPSHLNPCVLMLAPSLHLGGGQLFIFQT